MAKWLIILSFYIVAQILIVTNGADLRGRSRTAGDITEQEGVPKDDLLHGNSDAVLSRQSGDHIGLDEIASEANVKLSEAKHLRGNYEAAIFNQSAERVGERADVENNEKKENQKYQGNQGNQNQDQYKSGSVPTLASPTIDVISILSEPISDSEMEDQLPSPFIDFELVEDVVVDLNEPCTPEPNPYLGFKDEDKEAKVQADDQEDMEDKDSESASKGSTPDGHASWPTADEATGNSNKKHEHISQELSELELGTIYSKTPTYNLDLGEENHEEKGSVSHKLPENEDTETRDIASKVERKTHGEEQVNATEIVREIPGGETKILHNPPATINITHIRTITKYAQQPERYDTFKSYSSYISRGFTNSTVTHNQQIVKIPSESESEDNFNSDDILRKFKNQYPVLYKWRGKFMSQ